MVLYGVGMTIGLVGAGAVLLDLWPMWALKALLALAITSTAAGATLSNHWTTTT